MKSTEALQSGRLQPCLQISQVGWKILTVTNTQAYFNPELIMALSFIVQTDRRLVLIQSSDILTNQMSWRVI